MKVSLQFIADKAHVSKSLVSKVINDREVRVSKEKREEILRLAKEYNYVPNMMASSLRTKKTYTIALLIPDITFDYFSKLSYAVEKTAREQGYNVIICNTAEEPEKEKAYLDMFRIGIVDGLLVCPTCSRDLNETYQKINYYQFPIGFVDRYVKRASIPCVATDNLKGSYFLTKKLLDKGYRRVEFIGRRQDPLTSDQEERFAGYEKAMRDHNCKPIRHFLYKEEGVDLAMVEKMSKDLPQGIILSTSWDISELLKVFQPAGISIPRDVEIAAYDRFYLPYGVAEEIDLAKSIESPLMIMEQQPYEIGKLATEALIKRIEGQKDKPLIKYVQPIFNGREFEYE